MYSSRPGSSSANRYAIEMSKLTTSWSSAAAIAKTVRMAVALAVYAAVSQKSAPGRCPPATHLLLHLVTTISPNSFWCVLIFSTILHGRMVLPRDRGTDMSTSSHVPISTSPATSFSIERCHVAHSGILMASLMFAGSIIPSAITCTFILAAIAIHVGSSLAPPSAASMPLCSTHSRASEMNSSSRTLSAPHARIIFSALRCGAVAASTAAVRNPPWPLRTNATPFCRSKRRSSRLPSRSITVSVRPLFTPFVYVYGSVSAFRMSSIFLRLLYRS
mmetsp:Transcript_42910/g.115501  ORF Transcript_42910/g.115501 Transcript_42910/m.115501 type:complete len:275 (+) Transcript_42910:1164-1988(+)